MKMLVYFQSILLYHVAKLFEQFTFFHKFCWPWIYPSVRALCSMCSMPVHRYSPQLQMWHSYTVGVKKETVNFICIHEKRVSIHWLWTVMSLQIFSPKVLSAFSFSSLLPPSLCLCSALWGTAPPLFKCFSHCAPCSLTLWGAFHVMFKGRLVRKAEQG